MARRRGGPRRGGPPRLLGELLGEVGVDETSLRLGRLSAAWARLLPPRVPAWPVRLRGETLEVVVETATWAQELSLLAPRLCARLREEVPDVPVRSLRLRVGPLPRRPEGRPPPPLRPPLRPAPLPEALLERLARIEDPELRRVAAEAVAVGLAAEAARRGGR